MDCIKQITNTHLLYVYCIVAAQEEKTLDNISINGIDEFICEVVQYRDLALVICRLRADEYNADSLELKMLNPQWLTRNAVNHHEVNAFVNTQCNVLPLPFCTLFSTIERLYEVIDDRYEEICKTLTFLKDKQVWSLKIYCREEQIRQFVKKEQQQIMESMQDLTPGKRFLMMKKNNQSINERVEQKQEKFVEILHGQLEQVASHLCIHKTWPESDKPEDTMVFNCSYLVPASKKTVFIHILDVFEEQHAKENEWIVAFSGPWPPYHFAKMDEGW